MTSRHPLAAFAAAVLALPIAGAALAAQPPVRVPRAVLKRYVGEYDQNGSTVRVLVSGDTLIREVPGQRVAFVPISETLFRMGPVFTAEFVIGPAGAVTQVLTDGIEIEYRLPRRGAPAARPAAPAAAPAPVRVPRSVLERYVGVYEYIPGQMSRTDLRVVVRLDGDTLTRSLGGQRSAVLTPLSATRFRVGDTRLVTEFVIDDAGVTQVMGTGFQQMLARLTNR